MMQVKAGIDAQMHVAASADERRSMRPGSALAALDTTPVVFCSLWEVIANQCDRSVGSSTYLHCLSIGSEQLH